MVDGKSPNFVAVNLAAVKDPHDLANLIDDIGWAIENGDDVLKAVDRLARNLIDQYNDKDGRYSFAFSEALELKPNVMGIGVNLNSIIDDVINNFRVRRERKKRIGP